LSETKSGGSLAVRPGFRCRSIPATLADWQALSAKSFKFRIARW
jgi:hypothetical protein